MILADYRCPHHGTFECMVESPSPDFAPCPVRFQMSVVDEDDYLVPCGAECPWVPFPVTGRVRIGEVVRGGVDKPDSPMFLDTRALGEGQPYDEWKADREKVYAERRFKESKEF